MEMIYEEYRLLQEIANNTNVRNNTVIYDDMRKVIKEELKEFKKEIIEEIEKSYCEHWCIRKD